MVMASLKRILLIMLITTSILPQLSSAMNLGTLQKPSSADISAGETAVFHMLFWSDQEQGYDVRLTDIKAPQGWNVIPNPGQFMLNSTPDGRTERIYLSSAKNTITAKLVDLYVTAPSNEAIGNYTVSLAAAAGSGTGTGFSLVQERRFLFGVNVISGLAPKQAEAADTRTVLIDTIPSMSGQSEENKMLSGTAAETSGEYTKFAAYLFLIAVIVAIAWRVYRYD